MTLIKHARFVCLDCEFTGLDPENDRVLEVAAVRFTIQEILDQFDTLVNPGYPISPDSFAVHAISQDMVADKAPISQILPDLFAFIGGDPIVGHAIELDLAMLEKEAMRANHPCLLSHNMRIDTLRLARFYGDSPNNSLSTLASHFNVPNPAAHRALNDVMINISVFKHLIAKFRTVEEIRALLSKPIKMKYMPLGKHKGRKFSEIPLPYLQWAAHADFDQDLLYTIRSELKKRKQGGGFGQTSNPFAEL